MSGGKMSRGKCLGEMSGEKCLGECLGGNI